MKRVAVIALVSYLAFALEFLLYNFWGPWGKPELLILAVIFFNLYLGIRFSIIAAVFGGLFKDSSGIAPFGTYILTYICGAYITTLVRRYVYQPGSRFSRLVVTCLVVLGCFLVQVMLACMNHDLRWGQGLVFVLVPQMLTTMIAATYVFARLSLLSQFFALKSRHAP